MHLKNPFGMRNGKIVMIRDITTAERGQNATAFARFAKLILLPSWGI